MGRKPDWDMPPPTAGDYLWLFALVIVIGAVIWAVAML